MQYNLLRFWFLLDPKNEILLSRARDLFKEFPNRESLLLYLEIVCTNNLVVNGKEIVLAHGDFLDEAERLMYYAKFSMYENGYTLCKSVMDTYCIDEFIAAAIIECCVNTGHIKNAISYTEKIKSTEDSEALFEKVFENLEVSTECRKNIIDVYSSIIPPIELCCYFGCESHNIDWID